MIPASLERDRFIERAAGFAAFALPALLGVIAASREPYWLDSPELTAAVQTLGITHPPGHPLYVILAKPFTLLPLGGIAFRVSLASAFFGACASLLLYHLIFAIVRRLAQPLESWIVSTVSLAAALIAAVAPGWWFQCVRQEVYSLQAFLVLAALFPFAIFSLSPPDRADLRYLYLSAFLTGIGLTNHHFIMLCAVPCAVPQLVALSKRMPLRRLSGVVARLVAATTCGLVPYLLLPLRSASGVAVSLGGVHSPSELFWVVSAKVYQKTMARQHSTEFDERSVDALFTVMGQMGPVVVVVALGGFYMMLRRRRTRMTGALMALLAVVPLVLRAAMGFDPFNPDYYGYLLSTLAALSVGFAVFAAVLVNVVRSHARYGRIAAVALTVLLALIPLLRAKAAFPEVSLTSFRATRLLRDQGFRRAVPGSLIFAFDYNLFFMLWSARFIDGSRPDLTVTNPTMLAYPGYLNVTLAEHEELKPLARAMLVQGELTESAVASLALLSPFRMEPSLDLSEEVVRYMRPDAMLYQTVPEPLAPADVEAASPDYLATWQRLYEILGDGRKERETLRMLTWTHFQDALFMARRGDREGAMKAVEMARLLAPESPELKDLLSVLEAEGRGPVDIAPFVPKTGSDAP